MLDKDYSLKGRSILVTGVSRPGGIGSAIVKRLFHAGASVFIHGFSRYDQNQKYKDSDNDYLQKISSELTLESEGRESDIVILGNSDLSQAGEAETVVKNANKHSHGLLDGLVINHAYSVNEDFGQWKAETINEHFQVNVTASMLMIQTFVKNHNQDQHGSITMFTSGQYLGPMTDELAYALSKEAIRCLVSQMATRLAVKKININCINPGPVDTGYLDGEAHKMVANLFPSKHWGSTEDTAKLVHFLQAPASRWITGQTIGSEGGFDRFGQLS